MSLENQLLKWYLINKRDLPWRKNKDPYSVWVSEIILQQTRAAQGLPYYKKFIDTYLIYYISVHFICIIYTHWFRSI
mgnify:CR=1 FL=1